jgi:hypothetical protein
MIQCLPTMPQLRHGGQFRFARHFRRFVVTCQPIARLMDELADRI